MKKTRNDKTTRNDNIGCKNHSCSGTCMFKLLELRGVDEIKMVPIMDVAWIEADDYCVFFHLIDGSVTCHTVRLGIFMERVLKNECLIFRRIHRSYAVNVKHIKGRIHNMLQVGNELLTISDSYLDDFNKDVIVVCNPDNKSPKNKKSPNNKDKDK